MWYVFILVGGAVSWKKSSQDGVVLSLTEAEYMILTFIVNRAMWLIRSLWHFELQQKIIAIHRDNQGTICMWLIIQFIMSK